jgi:hypothetical protein
MYKVNHVRVKSHQSINSAVKQRSSRADTPAPVSRSRNNNVHAQWSMARATQQVNGRTSQTKPNKTNKLNQHRKSAYISDKFVITFTIVYTIQKWISRDEDYEAAHSGIQHAIPSLYQYQDSYKPLKLHINCARE